jgi:hypothetical protein
VRLVSYNEETGPPSEGKPVSNNLNGKKITTSSSNWRLNGNFTQVPNQVLEDENLSPFAKLTYALLLKFARKDGGCFPKQQTLARLLGRKDRPLSTRAVRNYTRELEQAKYIRIKRGGHGHGNSLYYRILPLPVRENRNPGSTRTGTYVPPTNTQDKERDLVAEAVLDGPRANGTHHTHVSPSVGNKQTGENRNGGSASPSAENHRTCRVEIPGRAHYLHLERQAETAPNSLLSRDISELRRAMLDDQDGPCRLHLRMDCPRCAKLDERLRAELNARLEVPA